MIVCFTTCLWFLYTSLVSEQSLKQNGIVLLSALYSFSSKTETLLDFACQMELMLDVSVMLMGSLGCNSITALLSFISRFIFRQENKPVGPIFPSLFHLCIVVELVYDQFLVLLKCSSDPVPSDIFLIKSIPF